MKKLLFTLTLAFLFICQNAIGQEIEQGSAVLNIGLGTSGYSLYNTNINSGLRLSTSFEVGLFSIGDEFGVISLGVLAGFSSKNNNGVRRTTIAVAPRGIFHFTVIPVDYLDVYAVIQPIMLLFNKFDYGSYSKSYRNERYFNTIVGARYFFSYGFAAFVEVGYSFSYLTAGVSLKF